MKKMKRLVAAMIALIVVATAAGYSVPAEAAAKAPKKITLTTTAKTVDIKGKVTVSVKSVKPSDASKSVKFKSSNKKIATVSSKGVVTGKKAGKVTITVTSKKNKKVKKSIKLTVKQLKPVSLRLSASELALNAGGQETVTAKVKPAGVYCPVSYQSSDTSVATVDAKGKVTAKKEGTAVITVKTKEKTAKKKYLSKTCKVTVTNKQNGFPSATDEQVNSYIGDSDANTVLVDARLADVYQGWALEGAQRGGHLKNSVNISAQWIDCSWWSNKKENKTRDEVIQQELDANAMTVGKQYIIYDTNGQDAVKVAEYLNEKGYKNLSVYNAANMINSGSAELVSYKNYDLYVPAEIVKNISDHVVNGTALVSQAEAVVKGAPVTLLDVSWGDETNDPNNGSGYVDGHIPGAVHVNTDEYETPKVYVPEKDEAYREEWRLNSDEELIKLAGDKGVTKDSCVIIVGSDSLATTRMAVILRYLGCENVHVMSERLVGWNAKGYALETGINKPVKVDFGVTQPQNPDLIDTIEEAKEKLAKDTDYQLIDTRTIEEWNGTSSGYGYHDLMGKIPGTIHSPSGTGYSSSMLYYENPDRSMRSKEILEAMWEAQGIDTSKHMSFFCGSGWRAAAEVWDALVLGYEKVSLYSDGWIGWSNEGHPYVDKDGRTVFYDKTQNKVVEAAAVSQNMEDQADTEEASLDGQAVKAAEEAATQGQDAALEAADGAEADDASEDTGDMGENTDLAE